MVSHSKNWRKRSNAGGDSDLPLASSCPPSFLPIQPTDMLREAVRCDKVEQRTYYMSVRYRMTFDNVTGMVYRGQCPYN